VLGTFALYYREPRLPTAAEVGLVEATARLARVAIERRRDEAAVRDSEERFRAFMDHCPAAAFIKDADGRYVYVNPVWLAQFDPPPGDWAGQTAYDFWPRDTAYLFRASDRRCLEAGVVQSEETGVTPAGDRRAWLVLKFPLDREGERFVGGLAWDVTARQTAEAAARDAQARLLERERREKEIVAAGLEASRADVVRSTRLAALGQIAASVAHDLRNPLGVVRNATFYLGRRFPTADPKWAEYLGLIEREVAACDGIIGNLLELARPKPPVAEPADIGELVRPAFARLLAPGATRLVLSLDPDPLVVAADPVQLRQVFDNLLKNAADAVRGVGEVRVTAAAGPDGVRVVVADTGPGVPAEHRAHLFQPLFTTKAKGTGLGLWICQQVLERHGGSIRLIDGGPGAAFEIRLPGPPPADRRDKLSE
jgi:PAS domain S-box-containing protein